MKLVVNIPEPVLLYFHLDKEKALFLIKRIVALEFYKNHGASLGYCAEIAGMTEEDFIKFLGSRGISIFHFDDASEFIEEIENA